MIWRRAEGGWRSQPDRKGAAGLTLVDAEILARGVCLYEVNRNIRQAISPLLVVPRDVPILVETAAPANPYELPASSISSLMQFAPEGSYGHRLRVRGVVTRYEPGRYVWIRATERGLRVQTRQVDDINIGDEVDVLGFPGPGDYTPVLEDAVFRKSGLPVRRPFQRTWRTPSSALHWA